MSSEVEEIEAILRERIRCDATGLAPAVASVYLQGIPEAAAAIAALRSKDRDDGARELPRIEFHQQDFMPGFAAFLPGATTPAPDSRAFCVVNLGSLLAMIQAGDMARSELPYFLAESMMHEVIHVLEQWAGVEFNEERVEALLEKYRAAYGGQDDESLPLSPARTEVGDA